MTSPRTARSSRTQRCPRSTRCGSTILKGRLKHGRARQRALLTGSACNHPLRTHTHTRSPHCVCEQAPWTASVPVQQACARGSRAPWGSRVLAPSSPRSSNSNNGSTCATTAPGTSELYCTVLYSTVPYYTIRYQVHLRLHLQINRRHIQIARSADVLRTSSIDCSSSSIDCSSSFTDCSSSSINCSYRRYTGTSSQIRLSVASRCFLERLHGSVSRN